MYTAGFEHLFEMTLEIIDYLRDVSGRECSQLGSQYISDRACIRFVTVGGVLGK